MVYRISFSLSSFFVVTALLSCTVASKKCDSMCCLLLFQLPFYLGLLVVSLLMPNGKGATIVAVDSD